ncbi:MAG: hypothetical protein FJY86_04055, partial [Candidatus Diapherotrites archaeon]|nr:hypothetical protein [Candidatus Diapherotrites archaeon]
MRLVWAGIILALFFFSLSAWGQTSLGVNEVYIQNYDNSSKTNDVVSVPIAFPPGQAMISELPLLQLQPVSGGGNNLVTQVVPTSYYKDGKVRTAVARVLFSSGPASGGNPAPEQVYQLGTYAGSPPAFQSDARVMDLVRNQNGSSIRVTVKDSKGGEYAAIIDIDGMIRPNGSVQNCDAKSSGLFPANCVKQLESGPVSQSYEIHSQLYPVPGGVTEDLSYLFSMIAIVNVYSSKNYATFDIITVNGKNLDEDTPTNTGGPVGNGPLYTYPQHGIIFYTDLRVDVVTSASHSLFALDNAYMDPSFVQANSPTSSTYWIMPSDAEQYLSTVCIRGSPCTEWGGVQGVSNPTNYLAGGQALLSRLVV